MPTDLSSLFHVPTLILAWIATLAIAGGPLLWRFLNYRPVTRCEILQAVANVVATGSWLTLGLAAINAHERGLISVFTSVLVMAFLFAGAAGASSLSARWCPDKRS
ncbi:hypothetical protein WHZ77_20955 [Bradyrhizobium sp. A5]|uniref:hypothetical protein n=1 Tax=Bradyrhizobium sp. A5 TaxID=3133696 RepID=UPI0032501647